LSRRATSTTGLDNHKKSSRAFRREIIHEAALELFAQRGYTGVSIDEIAAKAGISGPAIYRHYRNKEALLAVVLESTLARHWTDSRAVLARASTPRDALTSLVQLVVSSAVERRGLVSAYKQLSHVRGSNQKRLRAQYRLLVGEWASVVSAIRADLSPPEVRLMVHAVLGMIEETLGHRLDGTIERSRLEQLISSLALAALAGDGITSPTSAEPVPQPDTASVTK